MVYFIIVVTFCRPGVKIDILAKPNRIVSNGKHAIKPPHRCATIARHVLSMIAGGNLRKTQRGLSAWPAAALIAMVGVLSCAAAASGDTTASSPTMNRYLAHIFNKYGSRGKIGFEGLEHLMHSLRLGGVEFQHTVAEHRSKDFRLPEIVLNVTHEHETTDEPEAQAEPVVAVPVVVPKRDESANRTTSGGSDGVVFDGAGDGTDDMWRHTANHDPKHRHPRHNGTYYGFTDNSTF